MPPAFDASKAPRCDRSGLQAVMWLVKRNSRTFATRKSQRIDGRPRPRSGRRTGVAPLGGRRRASAGTREQLDQTKNTAQAYAPEKCMGRCNLNHGLTDWPAFQHGQHGQATMAVHRRRPVALRTRPARSRQTELAVLTAPWSLAAVEP